ncbi:MAG: SLATT domain-containing protein [Corynebacterium sp.]|nr:SLATT domain-containing protein [Corynebacterium sp.]
MLYSQIENEYGSVVYSHATQEEQCTRLTRTEHHIKVTQIALSTLSTVGLISIFFTQRIWITTGTAVITFLLLFLNSYSFRLEIEAKATRHRKASDQLWLLMRKYLSFLIDFPELELTEARERRDALIAETAEIYSNAERTDDKSFDIAQKRLKEDGLKEFSREELNRLLPEALQKITPSR